MARKWSNLNLPGALHFATGNVLDRKPVFKQQPCCEVFVDVFAKLLREWPCKLIAYVLMPDHFHTIVNPRDGRVKEFLGTLKALSAKGIVGASTQFDFTKYEPDSDGAIHQVWQESFKALPLWSGWMIQQKINYIHANPVKAGLVTSAKDYAWSSFNAFYSGAQKPLTIDREWGWPDDSEKLSKAMRELGWRSWENRSDKE